MHHAVASMLEREQSGITASPRHSLPDKGEGCQSLHWPNVRKTKKAGETRARPSFGKVLQLPVVLVSDAMQPHFPLLPRSHTLIGQIAVCSTPSMADSRHSHHHSTSCIHPIHRHSSLPPTHHYACCLLHMHKPMTPNHTCHPAISAHTPSSSPLPALHQPTSGFCKEYSMHG